MRKIIIAFALLSMLVAIVLAGDDTTGEKKGGFYGAVPYAAPFYGGFGFGGSGSTFGNTFGGTPGISSANGVQGGNFNSYAQNTQAYNNQIAASNYSPYSSFNNFAQGPANWGTAYGNSFFAPPYAPYYAPYAYGAPFYGGCGGYGCGW